MTPPLLALTVGDVAGIGPEVSLKALAKPLPEARVCLYAPLPCLLAEDARLSARLSGWRPMTPRLVAVTSPDQPVAPGQIAVLDPAPELDWAAPITPGQPDARCARLQLAALELAIAHARAGSVDGICTAPWNKGLFAQIGAPTVGHTEVLARAFGVEDHVMMLAGARLRVALVTVHVPLSQVSAGLTRARLLDTLRTTASELGRWFGLSAPRLAVCGLNPHAGEGGVMGREELEIISPALEEARQRLGVSITGPLPADTLFARFGGADATPWDAVICMYHDQGLIPLKLLHFGRSANITLGLPILRTSVDHGTAHDIAGQGVADEGSMRYAMELAVTMAQHQRGQA